MSQVKWVLVAGTGQYHLPDSVLWVSQALGTELGRRGFGLVTGVWEGVDWVVSETFAKELEGKGVPLASLLLQIVRERSYHEYPGGRIVYVPVGTLEFTESIKYCDAVVLVGGEGGTYQTFQIARQEQKPIFPIPGTGGDAQRAFRDILSDWPMPLPREITEQEFLRLDGAITSPKEAAAIVDTVVYYLDTSTSAEPPRAAEPGALFISYSHQDRDWLNKLTEKLRPLQQRGVLAIWADSDIKASQEWEEEIQHAIRKARVAILLVSSHSVNSDFIATKELTWLLEAVKHNGLRLFWVPLSSCDYNSFGLAKLQAARDPSMPLDRLSPAEQNVALVEVCREVEKALKESARSKAD
jgi:hypothetical protein